MSKNRAALGTPKHKKKSKTRPHLLDLYRLAVQGPEAEVDFFRKAYRHYAREDGVKDPRPTRLKEDFCGTTAIATTWVKMHDDHRAIALDLDYKTIKWAQKRIDHELGKRARDLHLIMGDVMELTRPYVPMVDVAAATNFSTFFFKTRKQMRHYFEINRQCLAKHGLLIIDAYGGMGGQEIGEWHTAIKPERPDKLAIRNFTYIWEQKSYNPVTAQTDCRIHFKYAGKRIQNAFRYDWRLWTMRELIELMLEAGFRKAEAWCDGWDDKADESDGRYRPIKDMDDRHDWIAYIVGVK
ncbi:MAG: hypothetical protein WD042_05775 [Phycisphaeraceae bacterium]